MGLIDTVEKMISSDYKDRFIAEYQQTKIRYERLKAFNTNIEAANRTMYSVGKRLEMQKHDCPDELLKEQECIMEQYLHILELRAAIEGIDLNI